MKKAQPKTRFTYYKGNCYILHKFHLAKVEELKRDLRAEKSVGYGWEKSCEGLKKEIKLGVEVLDNLQGQYKEKTDRLNQLSKHYNDLIVEHKEMKYQNFDYKNQLQNISQERNDLFNANLSLSASGNEKDAEIKKLEKSHDLAMYIATVTFWIAVIIIAYLTK